MALFRSILRLSAAATNSAVASQVPAAAAKGKVVPQVMAAFGHQKNRITFISHPGVMAICKLLEMRRLVLPRAVLTQENVDAIREFDEELADKCQIALDNDLAVNFMDLEYIDRPAYLRAFQREKDVMQKAREAVMSAPPGVYEVPACAKDYLHPMAPREWREADFELTPDQLENEPELVTDTEVQDYVRTHLLAATGRKFESLEELDSRLLLEEVERLAELEDTAKTALQEKGKEVPVVGDKKGKSGSGKK